MGVGLYLIGRYGSRSRLSRPPRAEVWLGKAEEWARANLTDTLIETRRGQDHEGHPALLLNLHPSAEEVEIISVGGQRIVASAKTSTTGSGYHVYVCDVLRRLGAELNVTWEAPDKEEGTGDETGYFHTNDRAAVDQEMLSWLQAMARQVLAMRHEYGPMQISMPVDYQYEYDGAVATQMGPRDVAWLEAVATEPERGLDFFSWWEDGLGAPFCLGRALCRMWRDVRWRPPIVDAETEILEEVATHLERAHRLNPTLSYPWREWQEILAWLGRETPLADIIARGARQAACTPRLGYRRHDVTVQQPGGWSIRIPGSFAEAWEDEGKNWCAWESPRTVWLTTYTLCDEQGLPIPTDELLRIGEDEPGERLHHHTGQVVGRALIQRSQEDEHEYELLQGVSAVHGNLAQSSISFDDPADRQWAIDTWHSISHPGQKTEEGHDVEG